MRRTIVSAIFCLAVFALEPRLQNSIREDAAGSEASSWSAEELAARGSEWPLASAAWSSSQAVQLFSRAQAQAAAGVGSGFSPFPVELRESDRLVVQGPRIRVTASLSPDSAIPGLKWSRRWLGAGGSNPGSGSIEGVSLQVRRQEQFVLLEVRSAEGVSGRDAQQVEVAIELRLPSRLAGLTIQGRDGFITATGMRFPLTLQLAELEAQIRGGSARVTARAQRADLRIESSQGGLDAEVVSGRVVVRGTEGPLQITTRSAELSVTDHKGTLAAKTFESPTQLRTVVGDVEYASQRGTLTAVEHLGDVRGRSEEGNMTWSFKGPVGDVRVESVKGAVTVQVPGSSGAQVRVATEAASAQVPESIRLQPGGQQGLRVYAGRLQGQTAEGRINIQTKEGSVRLR